jgi:hypothetical protein
VSAILRRATAAAFAALCAVSPAFAADRLAGHYYLNGVTEVGSELLLRDDGRFEWFLAYGAMDQTASGRWTETDGRVVLTTERPAQDAPLFRRDGAMPWDEDTEDRLRDMEADAAEAAAYARCPFLDVADAVSSPPFAGDTGAEPSPQALAQAAHEALAAFAAARTGAESAADFAMAARARADAAPRDAALRTAADAAMAQAVDAMSAYRAAETAVREAFDNADLDRPEMPPPRVPAACALPPARAPGLPTGVKPGQGLGVVVGDPKAGLRFSGIRVAFEFSDGHHEARVTNRGGWALLRPRPGAALRRIVLRGADAADGEGGLPVAEQAFDVDPAQGDVVMIALDSARLVPPMFDTMTLRIDGDALVPTWPDGDERGRYVRE